MTDDTAPRLELKPIGTRPPLGVYLRELVDRREYVLAVPRSEIRAQNLHTILGNVWLLITPLLQTAVYFFIFGVLLEVDRGVENYPVYLVTGVIVFQLFSKSMVGGASCMMNSETLMRSMYFPRAIIPLATALGNFLLFLPGLAVIITLTIATGEMPSWRWLLLPVVMAITLAFVTGVALFTARAGHLIPDLSRLLPHITRLGFYGSGILYDPSSFTNNSTVLALFDLNPMYQLISLTRWCLTGQPVPGWFWAAAPAYAITSFVAGLLYFYRGEMTYGSQR